MSTVGRRADRSEVVVVGGGQAGLAIGYFLARQGRDFRILEAGDEPAAAWRRRWDSLTLFTPARYDALPGLAFPGEPDRYPSRDEVADYLTKYVRHFELPVEYRSRVRSIRRGGRGYRLGLGDRSYEAEQVVIATGPFQTPRVPAIATRLAPEVPQLHSSAYRSPSSIGAGPVLVVGGGNTGFQIAAELSASHEVHLSIGSRQTPLPQRILGRDLFWYLDRTGLIRKTRDSRIGRRAAGRDTLIGSSPRSLHRRHGVRLRGRAVDAAGSTVVFADGTSLDAGTVIWATGFGVDHAWIDVPVFDEQGRLVHRRGVTDSPGLYLLGLSWQHTRGSALLGWVKDDAEYIADQISAFASSRHAPDKEDEMESTADRFPTDPAGLSEARAPDLVELSDGDAFDLRIAPVSKRLGDETVRMLAYNGSIPGPILKLREGSEIVVNVDNQGDLEATVHWHGLRLENRYDGTLQTQAAIPVGGRFSARVTFPDPGIYWYHPHIREDYGQEMGLYGTVIVEPADPEYWPPVNRELVLTLDDLLLEDGSIAPFSRSTTSHVAMGRFGDVLLVNGETDLSLDASLGEVVRLYLVNTANTRTFKVALPGARMKLVGGDSGHVEHEQFVDDVVVAPSERVVVDVLFERAGEVTIEHRTPGRTDTLARVRVDEARAHPSLEDRFARLRTNPDMVAERERIAPFIAAEPDKTVAFIAEMNLDVPESAVAFTCPMHPEVVSDEPGHCPQCAMKLVPAALVAEAADHDHDHADHHHDHAHAAADGIEWEDDMVAVNRTTTPANMRWRIVDRETGAENTAIDWRFRVGDQVKIRVLNEMAGDHPMHHPFHIHGAGRFLVVGRDGTAESNLVWKDTVLVRTGETVDILLDVTNPGIWMAHCHIAEHHESGMMFSFEVMES